MRAISPKGSPGPSVSITFESMESSISPSSTTYISAPMSKARKITSPAWQTRGSASFANMPSLMPIARSLPLLAAGWKHHTSASPKKRLEPVRLEEPAPAHVAARDHEDAVAAVMEGRRVFRAGRRMRFHDLPDEEAVLLHQARIAQPALEVGVA